MWIYCNYGITGNYIFLYILSSYAEMFEYAILINSVLTAMLVFICYQSSVRYMVTDKCEYMKGVSFS